MESNIVCTAITGKKLMVGVSAFIKKQRSVGLQISSTDAIVLKENCNQSRTGQKHGLSDIGQAHSANRRQRLWLIKKSIVCTGTVKGTEELLAGTGEINGQEDLALMMNVVKSIESVKTAMVLWESAGHTRK